MTERPPPPFDQESEEREIGAILKPPNFCIPSPAVCMYALKKLLSESDPPPLSIHFAARKKERKVKYCGIPTVPSLMERIFLRLIALRRNPWPQRLRDENSEKAIPQK